jgi:archaellum component FlaC
MSVSKVARKQLEKIQSMREKEDKVSAALKSVAENNAAAAKSMATMAGAVNTAVSEHSEAMKTVVSEVSKKPPAYELKVQRDSNGLIDTVIARPMGDSK